MSLSNREIIGRFLRSSSSTFQIINGPLSLKRPGGTVPLTSTLLVLDSSFNPPHWGHFTLIKKASEFYMEHENTKKLSVLLLLSVNNADKKPKPATFDKRVDMMCIFADVIRAKLKQISDVSVGVTTYGKFVDKDRVIRSEFIDSSNIVYLVGFDTIARIFDPKYYSPKSLSVALGDFMKYSQLFCLTREDYKPQQQSGSSGQTSAESQEQLDYPRHISEGNYEPTIPKEWGSKVKVLPNEDEFLSVSSSAIRAAYMSGNIDEKCINELPQEIHCYITEQAGKDPNLKSIFSS